MSAVRIGVIGSSQQLLDPMQFADSTAGQMLVAGTMQGLVAYDAAGDVVPALARRWIVLEDGKSYIFRLRRAHWPDGRKVDARDVQQILQARLKREAERDPYGPAAIVTDVIAMTGDVVEVRLRSPQPDFLLLLAQASMGIGLAGKGTGPYSADQDENGKEAVFTLTPVRDGDDEPEEPIPHDARFLWAERASKAIVRFQQGWVDWVAGGSIADVPYLTEAQVNDRLVHFDPVQGLFGLTLSPDNILFDDPAIRAALSMAIDRQAVVTWFGVDRWKIAETFLPQSYELPHAPTMPAWQGQSMEERRAFAAAVVMRWKAQNDDKPIDLGVEMPSGPGGRLLFLALKSQLRAIGVDLHEVAENGDLVLVDEVAPYNSAAWYLGRVSCARKVHCNKEAEALLQQSLSIEAAADRVRILGEAEKIMVQHGGFIPLAMPVRWSLVTPRLNGFRATPRAVHALVGLVE